MDCWKYKQYNHSKPSKYHIKTFGLFDSLTIYCYNVMTYIGTETSYTKSKKGGKQSEKIFEYLPHPPAKVHHTHAD